MRRWLPDLVIASGGALAIIVAGWQGTLLYILGLMTGQAYEYGKRRKKR